jgi:hypothetical protein
MGESQQSRQADYVLPPRAGLIGAVAVTTSAGSQQMTLLDNQAKDPTNADALQVGPLGCYVSFTADGGDVYVVFGPTQASVTGANAPVIATTGVNVAGVAYKLKQDVEKPLLLTTQDVWMGYIGSASCTLRFYRSSPFSQAC